MFLKCMAFQFPISKNEENNNLKWIFFSSNPETLYFKLIFFFQNKILLVDKYSTCSRETMQMEALNMKD